MVDNISTGCAAARFISWNVKGLNGPVKRARIFNHLKYLNCDIAFLQETHLLVKDQNRLKKGWVGQVFHSNLNTRSRGTAILIHKKIQFKATTIISDPQGRFVMVPGLLFNRSVVLVNVYAPNWDDEEFIKKIISLLPNLTSQQLIFGGDLNCIINPALDRSNPKVMSISKMAKLLADFMEQVGSVDPWRFLFPQNKSFSFFSPVHHSYSRIDYFFIDQTLLPYVRKTEYSTIIESDHAPVLLDLEFPLYKLERPPWKFDKHLLSDSAFCELISQKIDDFINSNKKDDISPSLLWETLKVVIRGEIISYSAKMNKVNRIKQEELIKLINVVDAQYCISPSPELYKKKLDLQTQYNLLLTEKTERLLLNSRGYVYEYGDKASRLLAHQLKSRSAAQQIPQIRKRNGELTVDPGEINDTFTSFYSDLYTSQMTSDNNAMEYFFNNLQAPSVSTVHRTETELPLKLSEVINAIMSMQNGKTSGPDGYPIEFFKKFSNKLSALLLDMFNDSLSRGSLPQTLTEASITLLLKPGKINTECGSYRPISLLNSDLKILAKALALRLETTMHDVISEDQTGFILGRHSFTNVRRLLNIIHSPASSAIPEVVIALDAEKAFDRVEWEYLFACLKKFGYGPNFISWINLLYSSPKASVITNGTRSQYFHLSRGTRQGCPISPLLFALVIEPLSIALKSSPLISGIHRGRKEYKLSLYADDLLIYVSDPVLSVPHIVHVLEGFGTFSGYKLNFSKSECYPVNDLALQIQDGVLPFHISRNGFRYLGINITRDIQSLYQENYCPLVEKVKLDLTKWKTLNLSLAGKVNCIKMSVLPKFLYLFQCIPLYLPKSFFKSIDGAFISFMWNGGRPRLRLDLLQRPKPQGGLALPNLLHYYWAANIQKILYWLHAPDTDWCRFEASSCISTSLNALVTSSLPLSISNFTNNPIVINTIKIWVQFRQSFGFNNFLHISFICNNHSFPPARIDSEFFLWQRQGIFKFKDMYINGIFASFDELVHKFDLPRSSLFRYFQIRHFLQHNDPNFPGLPSLPSLDEMLDISFNTKKLISRLTDFIISLKNKPLVKIRGDWVDELGEDIDDDMWNNALQRVNDSSSCAKLSVIQFKVVHRAHFSKARLSKIYPNVSASCDRCHNAPANLTHMFWSCPGLAPYWSVIFETLSKALNIDLQPSAVAAIFGVVDGRHYTITKEHKNIIAFTTLLARRRILLHWKSKNPPKVSLWLSDLMQFMQLEKIKYSLRGSKDKFFSTWEPVLTYLTGLKVLPNIT